YNLKVNPNNARSHKNYGGEMATLAIDMNKDTAKQRRWSEQAIRELLKANEIFDGDAVVYIHLGNAYINIRNYTDGEKSLLKALSIDPTNRYAFMSLGYIYYTSRRYKEAADIWERIPPELRSPMDLMNLSSVYHVLGDEQKAQYYKGLSGK
ncbi:MAG: hypothetical protein ABUT20_54195, partial [Bacteroidota bacterium]